MIDLDVLLANELCWLYKQSVVRCLVISNIKSRFNFNLIEINMNLVLASKSQKTNRGEVVLWLTPLETRVLVAALALRMCSLNVAMGVPLGSPTPRPRKILNWNNSVPII